MRQHGWLIAMVVLMIGAGTPESKTKEAENQDYAKFQGTWTIVSIESGGKEEAEEKVEYTLTFREEGLIFRENDELKAAVKFELDETRGPKQITFARVKGIYDFKQDELHICYNPNGNRPTNLKTSEARPDEVLMILRKKSQR